MTIRPTVSDAAERLYAALGPLQQGDDGNGWPLLLVCDVLAAPLADVEAFASDTDTYPGWGAMLDPTVAPARALPWLAQMVGAVIPQGATEAVARAVVQANPTWQRGTPAAILAAVKATLIASQTASLTERYLGSAYKVEARVYTAETPDVSATTAAFLAALPAGIVGTVTVLTGWTIAQGETFFTGQTVHQAETFFAGQTVATAEHHVP